MFAITDRVLLMKRPDLQFETAAVLRDDGVVLIVHQGCGSTKEAALDQQYHSPVAICNRMWTVFFANRLAPSWLSASRISSPSFCLSSRLSWHWLSNDMALAAMAAPT